MAHKPPEAASPVEPEKAREAFPKPPEKKGGAFTLLEPLQFEGAEGRLDAVETLPFSRERTVSVAVNEMPLPDFIHYIFSEILDVNYVVDSRWHPKKTRSP